MNQRPLSKGRTGPVRLIPFILVAAVLILFAPSIRFEFISFDDYLNLVENPHLHPLTFRSLLHFWSRPYERLYIPVSYSAWWGIAAASRRFFGGLDPRPFHAANLILHIANGLLVFSLIKILIRRSPHPGTEKAPAGREEWAAGLGALFFSLHPVQVQAVAWATGLKVLLSVFFSLAALREYSLFALAEFSSAAGRPENGVPTGMPVVPELNAPIRGATSRTPIHPRPRPWFSRAREKLKSSPGVLRHYLTASFFFALALLTRPTAAAIPLIAWVIDGGLLRKSFRKSAVSLIPWGLMVVPILFLTRTLQPAASLGFVPSLGERLLVAGDAITFYIFKIALPLRLGLDYGRRPDLILEQSRFFLAGVLPLVLAAVFFYLPGRRGWLTSLGILGAGLAPVLGLVPAAFQNTSTVKDVNLYLPLLGPAFGAAWLSVRLRPVWGWSLGIFLLCSLGALTTFQIETWRDDESLFGHALRINPESCLAHNNLGFSLLRKGNRGEAEAHFRQALRLNPGYAKARFNLGTLKGREGDLGAAKEQYLEALRLRPDYAEACNNLGIVLSREGKLEEAISRFRRALDLNPDYAEADYNLGIVLARAGRLEEAVERYREALRLKPEFAEAHINLAGALARQGKLEEAEARLREALRLSPGLPGVHGNLGAALARRGKLDEAAFQYREAVRINPDDANALDGLGEVLLKGGKPEEASAVLERALRLKPSSLAIRLNLGSAYAEKGDYASARREWETVLRSDPGSRPARENLLKIKALGKN